MAMMNHKIKMAIMKLVMALVILLGLTLTCIATTDRGMVALMLGLIVLVVFPSAVLLSIDASRVIRQEMPSHKPVKIIGIVLGIPQAIIGSVLIAFGLVYPFFGLRDFVDDVSSGVSPVIPLIRIITALAMLGIGYFYLREVLGLKK